MTKIKWILGLGGAILCQESTQADPSFESVRVGIQGGYALLDNKLQYIRLQPSATDNSDISGRGPILGLTLDWCRILGNSDMLLGLEGSLNYAKAQGMKSTKGTFLIAPATANLETTIEFNRSLDFTMKVGYMSRGAALAYFKIGPSIARWKTSSISSVTGTKALSGQNSMGLIFGIGAEFPISDRFSWGSEYNYRRHKNLSHNIRNTNGVSLLTVNVTPSSHAIMFRLNYRISAPEYAETPPEKTRKRKRSRTPNE